MLAVLSSVGATTTAGCVGGIGGGNGGGQASCTAPSTDDLQSLFPNDTDTFTGQYGTSEGVSGLGTENYFVGRYKGPNGNNNGLLIAKYPSQSAAESNLEAVVSKGSLPATGHLIVGQYIVLADAQSQELARELVRASALDDGCASQLTFGSAESGGGDDTETQTEEQFEIGTPVWSQYDGNAVGTRAVDTEGLTASNPSSYNITLPPNREFDNYPFYEPVITKNALIYRGAIREKMSGEPVMQLPATETATPALVDGTLYMAAGAEIIAVNVQNGVEEQWRTTTGSNPKGIVATDDYIIAAQTSGTTAYTLDGSRAWNISATAIEFDGPIGVLAVANGQLYVSPGLGALTVHDLSDGSELWRLDERTVSHLGPNGGLYRPISQSSATLARFDSDGNQVWRAEQSTSFRPVAADESRVYAQNTSDLAAVSSEDGSEQWATTLPQRIVDVAVGSTRVYAVGSGDTPRLFTVDKQSGEQLMTYALNPEGSTPTSAAGLSVGSGVVTVASSSINQNRMQVLTDSSS